VTLFPPRPSWPAGQRLHRRDLLAVLVLAMVVRIGYVIVVMRHYHPQSDDMQYVEMAKRFAAGHGIATSFPYGYLHPTAFRPPVYPALLGSWYWLVGASIGAAQVLNVAIGALVVVAGAVLAARFGGRTAGLLAAGLLAVYPPLLANDGAVLSEPVALLILLGALLALLDSRALLAGALVGCLVLTRPSAQLYVPVLAVLLWHRAGARRAAVLLAAAAVVVLPWVARNDAAVGRPVVVTSNGFNLAATWSPEALRTGHFVDAYFNPAFAAIRGDLAGPGRLREGPVDAAFRAEGMRGLRSHLSLVPGRVVDNARYLFDVGWRTTDSAEVKDGRSLRLRHAALPFVWAMCVGGLVGLWRLRRHPDALPLILTSGYFVGIALVAVSPPRLRAPFDVLACVGVAVLVVQLVQQRAWRRDDEEALLPYERSARVAEERTPASL